MRKAIAIITVCLAGSAGWLAADTAEKSAAQKKSTQKKSTQKKSTQTAGKKSQSKSGAAKSAGKSAPTKSTSRKSSTSKPGASKSTAGKSASKSTAGKSSKSTSHKTAPGGKKTTSSPSKKTAHGTPARSWRAGQTAPTPDRYKEIQTALAQKGYLHGEPTGKWDDESADALRRFQQDQNLHATGKLDSLSIIALGLGPKYDASAEKPPAPQP